MAVDLADPGDHGEDTGAWAFVKAAQAGDMSAFSVLFDRYYDDAACSFADMQQQADRFEIGPGEGVYLPTCVPHWVENHEGTSISFSIPFYTRASTLAEYVNRINRRLRRLGLSPQVIQVR